MRAHRGPREALGMLEQVPPPAISARSPLTSRDHAPPPSPRHNHEQFTLAAAALPHARERARALHLRAAFAERVGAARGALDAAEAALGAVRASGARGALGALLRRALGLVRLVSRDGGARGFRPSLFAKLEAYASPDRAANLLHFLGSQVSPCSVARIPL